MERPALQLAIDTATALPLVALLQGENCLYEWQGVNAASHHETLFLGIEDCLQKTGFNKKDLVFLSVGIGPGMFTGLRIGISTAQFLSDTLKIPCVPVSSLMALAYQGCQETPERVWSLLDARSKRVYALSMCSTSLPQDFCATEGEEIAIEPALLVPQLKAGDRLYGEGAVLFRDLWPAEIEIAKAPHLKASSLGAIGWKRYSAGHTLDPKNLQPTYLKTGQSHL